MKRQRKKDNNHQKYILPLFVLASSIVFAILFTIVIMPAVLSKFGFTPILILLLIASGTTASVLSILFYLLLKKEIKL